MNTVSLYFIEDTLQWLATAPRPDSRDALRAARVRELAERGQQPPAGATPGSDHLANYYLHEAGGGPGLAADVVRQHWAAPYNNDYLVVVFPSNIAFKALDVVTLSSKEDLSFDDLKAADANGDQQIVLEMTQPLALKEKPWITSISVPKAKAGGALYLHCFFAAKGGPGEGGIARRVTRLKLFDACPELSRLENPRNVDGVARSPHPAIPPHLIPGNQVASAEGAGAAPLVSTNVAPSASGGVGAQVFERVFLTLAGPNLDGERTPWKAYVVLNVEMAAGQTPQSHDYIALADHFPRDAQDYLTRQWQYVSDLDEGPSYETWTRSNKVVNSNLTIADLDELESMYIFYGRRINNQWTIIGEPASFKKQKHWMKESLRDIGQKNLHEIVIPGAHDAGTFDPEAKGTDIAINSQAQNLDFRGQLALGIRYFDCRLQNWPKSHPKQPFYFNHGGAWTWTEITDLTSALKEFLVTDASSDIVILDFSRFSGFEQSDYTKFFNLFTKDPLLGPAMMSPEEARGLTISELFARGKRLLLLSDDSTARQDFPLGESINIDDQWANTNKRHQLKTFLDDQVATHAGSPQLWSLQAILTPWYPWPISPRADEVSRVLREWVVNDWWDKVNVVFCDFAAGADLVHSARVCNQKRYEPSKGNLFWYEHTGWRSGAPLPAGPPVGVEIGQGGWTGFKSVFASGDGWIYAIDWDGNLKRYHDTHWQNGSGPMTTPPQTISSDNWLQYREVFASSDGWLYAIDSIGKLWRWQDTGGDKLGAGLRIDAGWEKYKIAFATSDRWLYAIDSIGKLWRWQDTGGDKLADGLRIDAGWEKYKTAFATSDGVLYGIDWHGNLWSWRDTWGNKLANGAQVGTGWGDFRMTFATSQGRLYGVKD